MFLTPLFLILGAAAATAPLVLHLLQRKRRDSIPFPTLRFLQMATKQSSRRLRFENTSLWLLRTLILLLLGAAFAMPVLRTRGMGWMGQAPRDVAVVIDASYSMNYRVGRDTVWERAIEAATGILNGLGDKDRFCLFLAGEQPEALIAEPVGDRTQGLALLKSAKAKTTGSRLLPALRAATSALEREQKGRELELHVITDGQAFPWRRTETATAVEGEAEAGEEEKDGALPAISRYVTLLAPPSPVNVSPVELELNPPLLLPGARANLKVRVFHTGPDRESIMRLYIGNDEAGRRPMRLQPGSAFDTVFNLEPLPPGIHPARIETPEDGLDIDNAFHFLVRVRERLPFLCVGSEEDTLFLRTALRSAITGGDSAGPERIDADALAGRTLHDLSAIFLCNALPLSGQALAAVEEYVRAGGLLIVFPGDRASASDYAAAIFLPLEGAVARETPHAERSRTLSWPASGNDLMLPFQRGVAPPRVSVRRLLAGTGLAEKAAVVIADSPDQPFLTERPFGKGRVLLFHVSADRSWSDFPLSPFYLPLLARVVEYSAGVGLSSPYLWSAPTMPLEEILAGGGRETVITGPDGRRLPVSTTVAEGETLLKVEDVEVPGIYEVQGQGPVMAVNMRRQESDLTPLGDKELAGFFGDQDVQIFQDAESLQRVLEEDRVGRTFGEHLLWIVLILIAIEFAWANRLARARPALTDQLAVEPSGRIKGHPEAAS